MLALDWAGEGGGPRRQKNLITEPGANHSIPSQLQAPSRALINSATEDLFSKGIKKALDLVTLPFFVIFILFYIKYYLYNTRYYILYIYILFYIIF